MPNQERVGQFVGSPPSGLPPLTANRTLYVDSVSGNDNNPGTQIAPYQTFMRAWNERMKYGPLRARLVIQLLGAGPYTSQSIGHSICDAPNGYLVITGDTAAETTHYTGTFSGDFVGVTINTSAGLGVDTHKLRWVRITSGQCIGAEFQICEHTDNQITTVNRRFKNFIGATAITAGDTFKIFTPGTVFNATSAQISNLYGGVLSSSIGDTRHIFKHLLCNSSLSFRQGANVSIFSCKLNAGMSIQDCTISSVIIDAVASLGATNANLYRSAGIVTTQLTTINNSIFYGTISTETTFSVSVDSYVELLGGRLQGTINILGECQIVGTGINESAMRFDNTLTVGNNYYTAKLQISNGSMSFIKFAVTSGSCIRVNRNAFVGITTNGLTGGTTDPAGFGVDVSGGGKCLFVNFTPTLTGGTAGKDLKTTANPAGVANAVLNANNTSVDAVASPLGEILARVA